MLETIRQFAVTLLEQSGGADAVARRHAEHFLTLAETGAAALRGPEQSTWLDRLEQEHANFRGALQWLDGTGETRAELRLSVALTRFWYVRGHLTEARGWLGTALAAEDVVAASTGPVSSLRAHGLTAASALALMQGDYDEATRLSEESLVLARTQGEPARIANALSSLGSIVLAAGDLDRAGPLLEEAVELCRDLDETPVVARAVNNLGDLALTRGDYERAEALFDESLALLRELGDTANVARSLFNLGAAAFRLGRIDKARSLFRESIALSASMEDREDLAWCLEGFGALAAVEGDGERAARLVGAAGTVLEHMGGRFKPFERLLHDETVAAIRRQLTEEAYETERRRGEELSLEDMVECAVQPVD